MATEIETALSLAEDHKEARKFEAAYQKYVEAETLAKTEIEALGSDASGIVIRAYYIDTALGIGDVLVSLERNFESAIAHYLRVKDFPLANNPVQEEDLWLRLVRGSLVEGDVEYRRDNLESARAAYERVLLLDNDAFSVANSALYNGMLEIMDTKVRFWLSNPPEDVTTSDARDYPPALLLAMSYVQQRLEQIDKGLNYLGYSPDYSPIFVFGHLRDIARSFARFAAQANRDYINFTNMAEREAQTLRQFEQAVELSQAAIAIEQTRADVVEQEIAASEQAIQVAQNRARRAERASRRFETTGWAIARLQEVQAWAGAAAVPKSEEIRQTIRGYEDYGISSETMLRADALKTVAWQIARRTYSMEAARHRDAAAETRDAVTVAARQYQATLARRNAAEWSVRAAQWRHKGTLETLAAARQEAISAELLLEFGALSRQTAEIYMERAVEAAFLMERAYNLENNTMIRRIRFDYGDLSAADGLYSADLLLRDIDEFTFQSIAGIKNKLQSGVRILSLRKDFPFAFSELLKSGEAQFETSLEDFHEGFPGTYDGRVRRVRALIQGSAGPEGVAASLTSSAVSFVRKADGTRATKPHSSETLVLPRVSTETDISAPRLAGGGQLDVFENIGLGASWVLRIPPQWNAIDIKAISDVKFIIAYFFRHDAVLEAKDLSELPERQESEYVLDIRSGSRVWQSFEEIGNATLSINADLIPPHHRLDMRLKAMAVIILRPDGQVQTATIEVSAESGESGRFSTNTDGVIMIEDPDAPGDFSDISALQSFEVTLPADQNPDLFQAGVPGADLSGVYLIQLVLEYSYALQTNR